MRYEGSRVAFALVAIWLCSGGLVRTADAQTASCSGTQSNTDINGDNCSSTANSGSTASAQATGPSASNANSTASNNSSATSNAVDGSAATSGASNSSSATSSATGGSAVNSQASNSSSADTTATNGSAAGAQSDGSSMAKSTASDGSLALSAAGGGSFAQAQASLGSEAQAQTFNGASALAEAVNGSLAAAQNATPNTFVCAYATNGSEALGSDSSAPTCAPSAGGSAVVVSPFGNCGQVAGSPCAITAAGFGDNIVRLINPNGAPNAFLASAKSQTVCAMVYVFDDDQEMGECCGCPVSSAQVATFSVNKNLIGNFAITGGQDEHDGAFAVVAAAQNPELIALSGTTNGQGCAFGQSGACNFGCDPTNSPGFSVSAANNLLGGVTHSLIVPTNAGSMTGLTETPLFDDRGGDPTNLTYLRNQCGALVGNSSGGGICTCPPE